MQGYPNIRTVKEWDDDPAQLFTQSRVSANHNKAVSDNLAKSHRNIIADEAGWLRAPT
jgi:hypothetical protein